MASISFKRSSLENFNKYNSLLVGNAFTPPPVPSAYDLLETTILSSDAASIEFTSLNSTYGTDYKHLQLRWTGRSQIAADGDEGRLQLNSDTGANYAGHFLQGNGSSVTSGAGTSKNWMQNLFHVNGNNDVTDAFAAGFIDFLDPFDTSKYTTARSLSGAEGNQDRIRLASGLWQNTAAISTIKVFPSAGWKAGTRVSLYGIKVA